MTKEQGKAIERLEKRIKDNEDYKTTQVWLTDDVSAVYTVLNMLKEKDKEIDKRDNAVRKIINRLDNDINRIAKSKQENTWDDYRRCRLKAYKTKTREIKEYIEEQYFERKSKE